jgi:hypothetical protein
VPPKVAPAAGNVVANLGVEVRLRVALLSDEHTLVASSVAGGVGGSGTAKARSSRSRLYGESGQTDQ